MKLKTEVTIPEFRNKVNYHQPLLMIGSCFAENMGSELKELYFPIRVNPNGILYNPISIAQNLEDLLSGRIYEARDLFYANDSYHSFSHHGKYSLPDASKMLALINDNAKQSLIHLKESSHLFITFGTAWVFEHKQTGKIVSNCHKLPSGTFHRYRLSVEQITDRWTLLIRQLKKINPNLQIVFTVSPIRHLKDGAHENQLSKATLLLAIDNLIAEISTPDVTYFPSYEVVMDELRDYRFYGTDMCHLSDTALNYIREIFFESIVDQQAREIAEEVSKLLRAASHRPINAMGNSYNTFLDKQRLAAQQLQSKYPFVDLAALIQKLDKN